MSEEEQDLLLFIATEGHCKSANNGKFSVKREACYLSPPLFRVAVGLNQLGLIEMTGPCFQMAVVELTRAGYGALGMRPRDPAYRHRWKK